MLTCQKAVCCTAAGRPSTPFTGYLPAQATLLRGHWCLLCPTCSCHLYPLPDAPVLSLRTLLEPWRIHANAVAQMADRHGLAECQPVLHVMPQVLKDNISIVNKVLSKLLLQKAPIGILQCGWWSKQRHSA